MIAIGSALMAVGTVLIGLFTYLTLYVQPRLFPGEVAGPGGSVPAAPVGAARSHLVFGLLLTLSLVTGVALFSLGSAMVATTIGYGRG